MTAHSMFYFLLSAGLQNVLQLDIKYTLERVLVFIFLYSCCQVTLLGHTYINTLISYYKGCLWKILYTEL